MNEIMCLLHALNSVVFGDVLTTHACYISELLVRIKRLKGTIKSSKITEKLKAIFYKIKFYDNIISYCKTARCGFPTL